MNVYRINTTERCELICRCGDVRSANDLCTALNNANTDTDVIYMAFTNIAIANDYAAWVAKKEAS